MGSSIMDSILALIAPETGQALAARLGESPQSLHRGLAASTAALLDGLAAKVEYGEFRAQVLNLASDAAGQNDQSLTAIAADGPTGATVEMVSRFLPMVFGSQESQVARAIAEQPCCCWDSSARVTLQARSIQARSQTCCARRRRTCAAICRRVCAEAPRG